MTAIPPSVRKAIAAEDRGPACAAMLSQNITCTVTLHLPPALHALSSLVIMFADATSTAWAADIFLPPMLAYGGGETTALALLFLFLFLFIFHPSSPLSSLYLSFRRLFLQKCFLCGRRPLRNKFVCHRLAGPVKKGVRRSLQPGASTFLT